MADLHDRGTGVRERPASTTNTSRTEPRQPGAVPAGDGERRKKRGAWLWLLPLLALLLAGIILASLLGGDDDNANDPQGSGGTATQQEGQSGEAAGGATGGAAAGDGTLVARGDSLLPPPADGLGGYVGEQATGEGVRVLSVVQNASDPNRLEGFFVGTSDQDRTYVEWGGDVGADEADFQPEVGQRVNLEGPVRPAPENPGRTLKLDEADARTVSQQGGYVNADQVSGAE